MDILLPDAGLVFWMLVSFLLLLVLLRKFAWKPILTAVKNREESISKALNAAAEAEKKLINLQAENEALLAEARKERDVMLKQAREVSDKIVSDAKDTAVAEGNRLLEEARASIQQEKMKVMTELRNQVATLSVEIAEKILKENLATNEKQQQVVSKILEDVTLN